MRLLYIALGWAAGILLTAQFDTRSVAFWIALAVAAAAVVIIVRALPRWRGLALVLLALALGGLRLSLAPTTSPVAAHTGLGGLSLTGVIVTDPTTRDDRVRFQLAAESVTRAGTTTPTAGLVLVEASAPAQVHYGERVRATGILIPPQDGPAFSYADYLARHEIFALMPGAAVEVLSGGHGNPLTALLLAVRHHARNAIAAALPEPQAGLLTGILLGDESGIAPEIATAFATTGTSHIVAISGFNMIMLSSALMGIAGRLLSGRAASLVGIGFIVLYTLLVGATPAILRAALMSILLVVGVRLRRRTFVPASVAFAVLVLTMLNPLDLWDVGFQLSIAATLGLALFADPLTRAADRLIRSIAPGRLARALADALTPPLATTLAAQITVLPLVVLYFGRLSPLILPVNLLILPVQPALLALGALATLASSLLPGLGVPLFALSHVLLSWTLGVVRLFARLPNADLAVAVHPALLTLYGGLVLGVGMSATARLDWAVQLAAMVRRRAVVVSMLASAVLTLVLSVMVLLSRPDGQLHVWILNLGHASATLIQTPAGAHILVDGGSSPARLLAALGDHLPFNKRTLDVLILSQPDPSDVGALPTVLQRYDVALALSSGQPSLDPVLVELETALAGATSVAVSAGYALELSDGVRLDVLHPSAPPALGASLDDNSLVIRVTYGDFSLLLPGDLSAEGQQALLESGHWPLATALQLPRHGTFHALDAGFLAAAQPQLALLQSDPANRRGDPHPDTLALLGATPLYRTDHAGTLHLWTDGRDLWLQPERVPAG